MLNKEEDTMKYTNPIYRNEKIETNDIICESPFDIVHTKTKDENGNLVDATQVVVDINKLCL